MYQTVLLPNRDSYLLKALSLQVVFTKSATIFICHNPPKLLVYLLNSIFSLSNAILADGLEELPRFGKVKDEFTAKIMLSCRWDWKLSNSHKIPAEKIFLNLISN